MKRYDFANTNKKIEHEEPKAIITQKTALKARPNPTPPAYVSGVNAVSHAEGYTSYAIGPPVFVERDTRENNNSDLQMAINIMSEVANNRVIKPTPPPMRYHTDGLGDTDGAGNPIDGWKFKHWFTHPIRRFKAWRKEGKSVYARLG